VYKPSWGPEDVVEAKKRKNPELRPAAETGTMSVKDGQGRIFPPFKTIHPTGRGKGYGKILRQPEGGLNFDMQVNTGSQGNHLPQEEENYLSWEE